MSVLIWHTRSCRDHSRGATISAAWYTGGALWWQATSHPCVVQGKGQGWGCGVGAFLNDGVGNTRHQPCASCPCSSPSTPCMVSLVAAFASEEGGGGHTVPSASALRPTADTRGKHNLTHCIPPLHAPRGPMSGLRPQFTSLNPSAPQSLRRFIRDDLICNYLAWVLAKPYRCAKSHGNPW